MNRRLTLIGLILVAGFFAVLLIGPSFVTYKEFVASTSPARLPFTLPGVDSVSLTRLPDDHVVLAYIDDGGIYYRESDTRGATWFEPRSILSSNLSQARNLYAKMVFAGADHVLLLAWDAVLSPGNLTRRAFYATVDMATGGVIHGPALCSGGSGSATEEYPTIAGDAAAGYYMAWLVNASGNHNIAVRNGTSPSSWDAIKTENIGTDSITYPAVLETPARSFELVYSRSNATGQQIIRREILSGGTLGTAHAVLNWTYVGSPFTSMDSSLASTGDLVVSFFGSTLLDGSAVENASVVIYVTRSSGLSVVKKEVIRGHPMARMLQHVTFANDQVLTSWFENTVGVGGSNDVLFILTDFDMTNKNSSFHSILLADIFLSCGAFNVFVYFHLKKKKKFDDTSEPLNNHAVTGCFVTIGILMLLPFSGFQGERLGASYADGYVFPAPINLGGIIVIGFVFLFFGVTTPLIDKFWRRDKREQQSILHVEQQPFSWKQEFLRKLPHVAMAILILGFDPLGSNGMQFVNIQKYDRFNFVNEGGIIFDYVLRLNNIEIGSYAVKLVMVSGMVFLWILDLHVLLASPTTYYFMKDYFILAFRKKERSSMADFVVMFASLLLMILVLTFDPQYKLQGSFVSFAGFCAICFGDTAGMVIGRIFGRHKISKKTNKSWEGAIAGALVSFLSALIFIEWPFALLMAGLYLAVDLITTRVPISDNFLIPLFTCLAFLPLLPFVQSPLAGLYV
jgi:dolichol kinase